MPHLYLMSGPESTDLEIKEPRLAALLQASREYRETRRVHYTVLILTVVQALSALILFALRVEGRCIVGGILASLAFDSSIRFLQMYHARNQYFQKRKTFKDNADDSGWIEEKP